MTGIKPPADCRNAQLKLSAKQTRIPQQERRGVLELMKLEAGRRLEDEL
ncbi:MAG: hypothetical protein MRZ65_06780 [Lachnospiraceae bacterium]|nr:hypothetical protein [Lachnospiraceae bacterium]